MYHGLNIILKQISSIFNMIRFIMKLNIVIKNLILIICIHIVSQEWTDVNLKWNKSEYGNVEDIRIPPHKLWKPDVLMYNR